MSSPSASGDARFGEKPPHNGEGSSDVPFLGVLPNARSSSELLSDIVPGDTSSGISLPPVDEKQVGGKAPPPMASIVSQSQAPNRSKKINTQADSKPARATLKKTVTFSRDEKLHVDAMDLEDEKDSNPDSSEDTSESNIKEAFTIYDAVAGRLGYDGLVKENQQPVSAAEYLFRYQRGLQQDQHYEQFSAHRGLEHRLPDSDLLKAIHTHTSDFYGAMPDAKDSFESMDETALIAMGILLEELTAERLGKTGDLAFVEAAQPGEADSPMQDGHKAKRQKIKHEGRVRLEGNTKAESDSFDDKPSVDDRGRLSGQKRRRGARSSVSESELASEDAAENDEDDPSHNSEVESWISQTMLDSQGESSSHFGTAADLPIR